MLTIPSPQGGRWMEYETRRQSGVNIIPGSVKGLLQAIRHLQRGGMVMTGIDRPVPLRTPTPGRVFLADRRLFPRIMYSWH